MVIKKKKKTCLNNIQSSIWAYFINHCRDVGRKMKSAQSISDLDRLAQRKIEEAREQRQHVVFFGMLCFSLWDFIKCPVLDFFYLDKGLTHCLCGDIIRFQISSPIQCAFVPGTNLFLQQSWRTWSQRFNPLFHLFLIAAAFKMKR